MLIRITLHNLTFGLIVQDGRVTKAAPVAAWALRWQWETVERYYRQRGARITVVVDKLAASV